MNFLQSLAMNDVDVSKGRDTTADCAEGESAKVDVLGNGNNMTRLGEMYDLQCD